MRTFLLTLLVLSLGGAVEARAGVSVHVSLGGGCGYRSGYCGQGYSYCYAPRACAAFGYGYGYGYGSSYFVGSPVGYSSYDNLPPPVPAPQPAPPVIPAPAPMAQTTTDKPVTNQIPYGFDIGTRLIKSPWSGFVINGAAKAPEQVVYDANTGQAFRIPPAS